MQRSAIAASLLLIGCSSAALPAFAADASVEARLDARGVKYEIDEQGDYRSGYRFTDEDRTQLVFVAGRTERIGEFTVREVFSPAGRVGADRINGARALELLADSGTNKLGSWELHGDILYYVIKLPDSVDAAALESAMDIAAEVADNMEIKLSGKKDAL